MSRVLLVNPDYYDEVFSHSKVRAAISRGTPALGLASVAAPLVQGNHQVIILDLNSESRPDATLRQQITDFQPDFVGITSTTPLIKAAQRVAHIAKSLKPDVKVIAGGPHPTAMPDNTLIETEMDCVVLGEGDLVMKELVEGGISNSVPNIVYKQDGEVIHSNSKQDLLKDLDSLPYPAYHLFDIKRYAQPRISSRRAPLAYMETSRGCYSRCIFCNKNVHGFKFRTKSPLRVVDEMEYLLGLGFREIHIIDDIFTADMRRAAEVCEEILRRGLRFPWYPRGGIRVDRVSLELLKLMKRAGCYRIPFGVESGSQRIIDLVGKGIKVEQVESAVRMAKQAGLEVECYFMIGLPTETEDDIKQSIALATRLNPDYVKFAITIPLPGTTMFDSMMAKGQIKTQAWELFNFSTPPRELYEHDTLPWTTIEAYYTKAHRNFYFRPAYLLGMVSKTLGDGTFGAHLKAFLRTRW